MVDEMMRCVCIIAHTPDMVYSGAMSYLVRSSHVVNCEHAGLRLAHVEVVQHLRSVDVACG